MSERQDTSQLFFLVDASEASETGGHEIHPVSDRGGALAGFAATRAREVEVTRDARRARQVSGSLNNGSVTRGTCPISMPRCDNEPAVSSTPSLAERAPTAARAVRRDPPRLA